jgi:hypothetical protein
LYEKTNTLIKYWENKTQLIIEVVADKQY